MARINIEDSIYKDAAYAMLLVALGGDLDKTMGAMVRAWTLAQQWYLKTPDRMIPLSEWKDQRINPEIVRVGLAEVIGDRVRVKGADENFKWLLACSKKGKASGRSRREIIKESVEPVRTSANHCEPLTLPPSLSPFPALPTAPSFSQSQNKKIQDTIAPQSVTPQNDAPNLKIIYFAEQWKLKYRAVYQVIPKEAGLIKNSFKGMGLDKFKSLVDAYLQMNESYFISKRHDITGLAMNVAKISHFAQTGVRVSRYDANHIELREHNSNVFSKIAKENEP